MNPLKLLFPILLLPSPSHAFMTEIIGHDGRKIAEIEFKADLRRSVGEITVEALQLAKERKWIENFEAYEDGLVSINGIGNSIEIADSKTELKAWGWCFAVNDAVSETLPADTHLLSQQDRLTWFHGYAQYRDGEWVAQCVRPEPAL